MDITQEQLLKMVDEQAEKQLATHGADLKKEITEQFDAFKKEISAKVPDRKAIFGNDDAKSGYESIGEFARDVYKAETGQKTSDQYRPWLEKSANFKTAGDPSLAAGALSTGGALIPTELTRTLLSRSLTMTNMMGKCMIVPITGLSVDMPDLADYDESQGKVSGNVQARYVTEMAAATGNQLLFGQISLKLRELNVMIYASRLQLDNSIISLEPLFNQAVAKAFDRRVSKDVITGTGAGQPLGVINATACVSVAKETGQKADTIVYDNLLNMASRCYGYQSAQWYANQEIIPQLGKLSVAVGTGGNALYVTDASGQNPTAMPILGRPLTFVDECPILGDKGDIILADFSQYYIGQSASVPGIRSESSIHLKFDYRQMAFQFTMYVDGMPSWKDVRLPLNGTSKSPFVALAARA